MYREGRLSVHRRNKFRKRRAEKRGYAVIVNEILPPIRILLHQVMALKISIPKDILLVSTIDELRCKLQTTAVVPKGWYNYIAHFS